MSEKQRFTSNIVAKDSRRLNGSESAGGGGGGSASTVSYWDSDMDAPIKQPLKDIYINGETNEMTISGDGDDWDIERTYAMLPDADGGNPGDVVTLNNDNIPVWAAPASGGGGKSKMHTQTIGADLDYEPSVGGSVPYWVMDSPFNLDFDVSARTGLFVLNITEMYIESNGTNGLDPTDLKPVTGRVCIFDESNVNMIGCMPLTGRVMSAGASGAVIGLFTEAFEVGAYSGTIAIPLALTSIEATSNLTLRVYIDTPLTFNASLQSSSAGDINAELKYVYDFDEVTTQ